MRQKAPACHAMSTVLGARDHPVGTVPSVWRTRLTESASLSALLGWSMTQLRNSVSSPGGYLLIQYFHLVMRTFIYIYSYREATFYASDNFYVCYVCQHSLMIKLIIACGVVGGAILLVLVIFVAVWAGIHYKKKRDVRH